ncbi:MAG: gamma-glutamyl-gamma-aminobutyrate hydrolase family protein [Thermodesulfobacteriota bacterium]
MGEPASRVYVIQHIEWEPPGRISEALAGRGVELTPIRVYAGEAVPREMGDAGALVVMGGPMGVYEEAEHPFLREELRLIEDALRRERPILGTCLGSQLLAAALGARVRPGPRKELGWHEVILTPEGRADPLWAEAPDVFAALHWHGDVFDLPHGAMRLARSELTETQSFRYGTSAYGLLFHMEVTKPIVQDWVTHFSGELGEAGVSGAEVLAGAREHLANLHRIGDACYATWSRLVP